MTTPPSETLPRSVERLIADRGWLLGLARRLVRDEARAEDLTQDTLMAAARRPPGPDVANLRAWAAKVLTNRQRDVARSEARRARREEQASRPEREPSTAELFAEAASQATITRAVAELAEDEREIVMRVFYQGLSVSEVARRTGIPRSTAQSRLERALANLRLDLDHEHGSRRAWAGLFAPWLALCPEPAAGPAAGLTSGAGGGLGLVAGLVLALGAGLGALAWRRDAAPPSEGLEPAAAAPRVEAPRDSVEAPVEATGLERVEPFAADETQLEDALVAALGPRVPLTVRLWTASGEPVESCSMTLGDGRGRRYTKRLTGASEVVFERVAPGPGMLRAFIGEMVAAEQAFEIQGSAPVVDVWLDPGGLVEVALADASGSAELPPGLDVLVSDAATLGLGSDWWLDWRKAAVFGAFRGPLPEAQGALAPGHIGWLRIRTGRATHAHLVLGDRWIESRPLPSAGGVLHFTTGALDLAQQRGGVAARLTRAGLPVSGRVVEVVREGRPVARATSDDFGRIELAALPPGRAMLRTAGGEVSDLRFLEFEPGVSLELGDWELAGRVARGTLRGPGGAPSAGSIDVRMASWGEQAPRQHFLVAEDGEFALALPNEDCFLEGRGSRGALSGPSVFVPAEQTDLDALDLSFQRMVQIAVVLPLELPDTAVVRVVPEDAGEPPWMVLGGGRAVLDLMLDPDHYTLELREAPGGALLASTEGWFGATANSANLVLD